MTIVTRKHVFMAALIAAAVWTGAAAPAAQDIGAEQKTMSVRQALERPPYYGVFDYLSFGVDRGTVTLTGYAHRGSLRSDAEGAARRVSGVDEVANKLEVLPASPNDDRIRWATFYRIYTDDFLARYAPGGSAGARMALVESQRFPGMQPFGNYPIHIIVKGGRTTLFGVVATAADKQVAGMKAREVPGVFAVANELVVAP
jgi:hyperosmotically inducible periplasmic protein